MKILRGIFAMFFTVALTAMFGCGGGGGGGGGGAVQPTTATLKLLSQGTAGTKIRGIAVTVALPAGVTVQATPSTVNPAILVTNPGVVVLSGATVANPAAFSQVQPIGIYTPATPGALATVTINLPAQADFDLGEYVTVNSNIAAGISPSAAGFTLPAFSAVDLNGAVIPGVSSTIVVDIR